MSPRQTRALRGTAAAWVATVVAATAHTLAGDGAPAPVLIGVVGLLASPIAVALAGRRGSATRTALTVLASQALLHIAFVIAAGAGSGPAPMMHGHHAAALLPGTADSALSGLLPDTPMLLSHILAAVVTTLALLHGERMLRALGRGIRRLLDPDAGARVPPVRSRLASAVGSDILLPRSVPLSALSRRGPPAFVIAAR